MVYYMLTPVGFIQVSGSIRVPECSNFRPSHFTFIASGAGASHTRHFDCTNVRSDCRLTFTINNKAENFLHIFLISICR
jgi:hypothetical protein